MSGARSQQALLAAGGGEKLSLEFIASDFGDSANKKVPEEAQEGDFLVLFDTAYGRSTNTPPDVVPSGLVKIVTNSGDFIVGSARYHFRTTLSAGLVQEGWPGSTIKGLEAQDVPLYGERNRYATLVLRPSLPITDFAVGAPPLQWDGGGNPPALAIATTLSDSFPVLAIGQTRNPDGNSNDLDNVTVLPSDVADGHQPFYRIFNPGDALEDLIIDMNDTGNYNIVQTAWLVFNQGE